MSLYKGDLKNRLRGGLSPNQQQPQLSQIR
jgi:hypothetical protein